nr:hypothetical protein [uncultured Arsenicibacter sp.]
MATIVFDSGSPLANGDIMPLDSLKIKESYPLTEDFNGSKQICKTVRPYVRDGKLVVDVLDPVASAYADFYPSICVAIVRAKIDDNVRTITEANLIGLALSCIPNTDPNIKTLGEQVKGN